MSRRNRTDIFLSPTAPLLLALFVMLSSPLLLSALLLAAILHELGHYWVLRRLHAQVTAIRITALGAEMQVAGRLSYGGELLAAAAGPAVNLILALMLGGSPFLLLAAAGLLWHSIAAIGGCQTAAKQVK